MCCGRIERRKGHAVAGSADSPSTRERCRDGVVARPTGIGAKVRLATTGRTGHAHRGTSGVTPDESGDVVCAGAAAVLPQPWTPDSGAFFQVRYRTVTDNFSAAVVTLREL